MADQEVCRSFRNTGRCRFGDDCKYQHSSGEQIPQPERRERGECYNFRANVPCTHGDRCRFSHGADDTRGDDRSQEVCRNFLRGRCDNGDQCTRKHEGTPSEVKPRRRNTRGTVCFQFRDTGSCERGDECQFKHSVQTEEAGEDAGERRPRREAGENAGERRPRRPRKEKANTECYQFRDNGECARGDECRFTHGDQGNQQEAPTGQRRQRRAPQGECFNFKEKGTCERGDDCRFTHGSAAPESSEGETSRKPRKPRVIQKLDEVCNNFKAGKCRLGDRCRRTHEGAASA